MVPTDEQPALRTVCCAAVGVAEETMGREVSGEGVRAALFDTRV